MSYDFLQNIGKVSKVAKSMAMWVIAMDEFSKVYKDVEPKIKKATEAEAILKEVRTLLTLRLSVILEGTDFRSWPYSNKNNYN